MEKKITQICQIFFKRKVSKSPDFHNKFQQVAKNIEGFWGFFFFSYFHIVYSQIWLNHLKDDHNFSYITKLEKQKTLCTSTDIVQFNIAMYQAPFFIQPEREIQSAKIKCF